MSWKEPKTDWVTNPKSPRAEDFNRIEGNIEFVKNEIEGKKGVIVDAMNGVGLKSELTDTYQELANKITSSNQGAKIYTPGTSKITIPKGFHSGDGYVKPVSNLIAGNIRYGATVGGVIGSFRGNRLMFIRFGDDDTVGRTNLPYSIAINETCEVPPNQQSISHTVYLGWRPDGIIISYRNSNYPLYTDVTKGFHITTNWEGSINIGDYVHDREIRMYKIKFLSTGLRFYFDNNYSEKYAREVDMSVFAYQLNS